METLTTKILLALLFFLPTQAKAELEGSAFRDFSGGLNDNADPSSIAKNESPDLLNVVIDDPVGSLSPRNGFIQCGKTPSGNPATVLYNYQKSNGTQRLIVSDNSSFWQTGDCVTFTPIMTGLSASALPTMKTVRDLLWVVNRSTFPFTWDGSTFTLLDTRAGTPNPGPPIGAYIEFWKERVWIARTQGNASLLAFSALTDTAGNDIAPSTGSASWPANNQLFVDRDGGCPIYGIKAFRDNLYVFKGECGIFRIVFNNDLDVAIVKTLATVGTRFHYSVVELDNLIYFVGPDGIYAFDGDQSVRLTDKMVNKFYSILQPSSAENFKTWTEATDFDDGTLSSVSKDDVSGSVTLSSTTFYEDFSDGNFTANPVWTPVVSAGNFNVVNGALKVESVDEIYTTTTISTGTFQVGIRTLNSGSETIWKFISNGTNFSTSNGYKIVITRGGSAITGVLRRDSGGTALCTTPSISSSESQTHTWKVTRSTGGVFVVYVDGSQQCTATDNTYNTATHTVLRGDTNNSHFFDNFLYWSYGASGSWESDVYQAVSLSSWSTMEASYSNNGANISFQVRIGTDTGAVASMAYQNITPGATIPGVSSQTFVQFKTTLTRSPDGINTPQLDDLTANFLTGDISDSSIYAAEWKNRPWISATTGTSTSNNMTLIKTRLPLNSWVPYDLNIGPMVKYNDNFYGAASTHSAIYRLDFGTNDNGAPINWSWSSRDESWEDFTRFKSLMEVQTDFRKDTATNMKVGYSSNAGSSFTERTVPMNGSGRGTNRQFISRPRAIDFRFRLRNSTLDERATILGITGWAIKEPRRN